MFAPSQHNKIDDGISVRSFRRRWGGTPLLIRFRLLRGASFDREGVSLSEWDQVEGGLRDYLSILSMIPPQFGNPRYAGILYRLK